jgi:hypothetical protein
LSRRFPSQNIPLFHFLKKASAQSEKERKPLLLPLSLSQLGLSGVEMERGGGLTASKMGSGGDEEGFSF